MADVAQQNVNQAHSGDTRRDFLLLRAGAIGGGGIVATIWPFVDNLNPARDTLALSTTEVDLAPIQVGQRLTVAWRGKPVFIAHRTPEEIKAAEDVDISQLRDPQKDSERVQKPEWLIIVGVCTHLGCIPLGQKVGDDRGQYGGWFFPRPRRGFCTPGGDAPRVRPRLICGCRGRSTRQAKRSTNSPAKPPSPSDRRGRWPKRV